MLRTLKERLPASGPTSTLAHTACTKSIESNWLRSACGNRARTIKRTSSSYDFNSRSTAKESPSFKRAISSVNSESSIIDAPPPRR